MSKKEFNSELFRRSISPDDKDYSSFVKAELLYRIDKMTTENCSCTICMNKLEELIKYHNKLKESKIVGDG